jgi:hypothetical protein
LFLFDCRTTSNSIRTCRRQSRQDDHRRDTVDSSRSLSRVRFRPTMSGNRPAMSPVDSRMSTIPTKSILKKPSTCTRISSVDRDIARLTSLKQQSSGVYSSDDDDRSTTDSCLGSLSSHDSTSYIAIEPQLETLV